VGTGVTPERVSFTFSLEKTTMKHLKRTATLILALAFVSVLGCAGSAKQESTGEYFGDSWITTKVKTALVNDPQVKSAEVNVETFKGTVQLSGFVSSDAAMRQAVKVAQGVEGVTSVKNDMRIK
jgi:hyperosmotically inducible protein